MIAMKSVKKQLTITFLELPPTVDGRLSGPQSRDVYSLYRLPSRCCDLLAAIAKRAGYEDTASLIPALNKGGRLSPSEWRRLEESDVIGLSVITRTAPPSYEAARIIRSRNPRAKIIFGGPHISALPEEALQFGDVAVLNEGDRTILELLERFEESWEKPFLADVQGIAYRDGAYRNGDEIISTPRRPFLRREELNELPFPVYSSSVLRRITHQTICTSRGCPYGCEYCSVIQNFGRGYRCMSVDRTVDLIRHHLKQTRAPIFFADDNFTANRRRVKSILDRCRKEGIRLPPWGCQSRVEAAFDDELLDIMVKSRLNTIMVGFESVNDETLALYGKDSTHEKNREAMGRFHAKGIYVHGMFVLGSDADTSQTIDQTIAFAKEMNLDTAQFFALTPVPGPPWTEKMKAEGRVLTQAWHLYDAQHVVLRPKLMTPAELQDGIYRAFREFYSPREGLRRLFVNAPHRFQNCLIRFLGRRLVQRIVKETLPHHRALEGLNEWLGTVDELCSNVRTRLRELDAKVVEARANFSGKLDRARDDLFAMKDHFLETLDEHLQSLRESLGTLAESYHPFCRRVLDELHACFHSETEAVLAIAR